MGDEDYLEPLKAIYNFSKDNDFYKIKGGIIEGKVMTAEEINYFSKITIKTRITINACWCITWKYFKTCSCFDQVTNSKRGTSLNLRKACLACKMY